MKYFLFGLFFLLFVPSVKAGEDFYSRYRVWYQFDEQGRPTVEHRISLTNQKSQIYASSYQLILQGEMPQNIVGRDTAGPLKITTSQQDSNTTLVDVGFNQQVVGKGKSLDFSISYRGQPAVHNGQVWEISLPKLGTLENFDEYQLNLVIPKDFGKPAFISPSPTATNGNTYTFTKEQVSRVGVVAAFGNFQTFGFNLQYQLENPSSRPTEIKVALPPDTNSQRVFYDQIEPRPTKIEVDLDGNWLASFRIAPKQMQKVSVVGQTRILAEPTLPLGTETPNLNQYLTATANWPADNPQISALAKSLGTPQAIYNYVVGNLEYDYSRAKPGATRKGGLQALLDPKFSLCTEFTDLFITLARAAKIPAREVEGYAYTTDSKLRPLSLIANVYHAWPQYWDLNRRVWVSIDPTWGNTTGGVDYFNKLDFNHFAFVLHGLSDTEPHLSSSKIEVNFAPYKDYTDIKPTITWQFPWALWPGSHKAYLNITNNQGFAIYRTPVSLATQSVSALISTTEIKIIPPFTTISLSTNIISPFWPEFRSKLLVASIGEQTISYNIPQSIYLTWQIILGAAIAITIITLAILAHKAWGVYLQRHHR